MRWSAVSIGLLGSVPRTPTSGRRWCAPSLEFMRRSSNGSGWQSPAEILTFCKLYRDALGEKAKPIVVVPSSYNVIYEKELAAAGVSVIIYANHLLRASYPAMLSVAEAILEHGRSKEVDEAMMTYDADKSGTLNVEEFLDMLFYSPHLKFECNKENPI